MSPEDGPKVVGDSQNGSPDIGLAVVVAIKEMLLPVELRVDWGVTHEAVSRNEEEVELLARETSLGGGLAGWLQAPAEKSLNATNPFDGRYQALGVPEGLVDMGKVLALLNATGFSACLGLLKHSCTEGSCS